MKLLKHYQVVNRLEKARSSGHTFLSLDQAVPQRFFTLSPAQSR